MTTVTEAMTESKLINACELLLLHWDANGVEKRGEFEGVEYWSPAGRMVDTQFIVAVREALASQALRSQGEAGMRKGPLFEVADQTGKQPCGECHLQPGETCDICNATAALTHPAPQEAGDVKVGDTVRVLRCRNAYGEEVGYGKPFVAGETFVVGEVEDPGGDYKCPVVFPQDEYTDFWRADDVEIVTSLKAAQDGK